MEEEGLLSFRSKPEGVSKFDRCDVDWSRTRAYGMGINGLYLNLKGREPEGTVEPEDYDRVCQEIIDGLLELRDEDGTKVVPSVAGKEY